MSDFALSIVAEMYRRIGYEVEAATLPARRSLRSSDSGESDGEVMRTPDVEARFPNLIRIPEPLIEFDVVAFTAGPSSPVYGWDGLRSHSLCALLGILSIETRLQGMNVAYAEEAVQVFRMLKAGRCEYAILPRSAWLDASRAGITGLAEVTVPVAHFQAYHYVNKRHADLVRPLSEALRRMREEGFTAKVDADLAEAIKAAQMAQPYGR